MSQDLIGLILAVAFVAMAGAVLMLMEEISRDTPQGGRTAVTVTYDSRPATCVPARTVATRRTRGRHRR